MSGVLPGVCLPSGQSSCFSPPWLICFRTLPPGANAPLSQDGSPGKGVWEKQGSLWHGIVPWLLTPKEPFCACVMSPLPRAGSGSGSGSGSGVGGGIPDLLILYSDKVLPLFVPAMTVVLRRPQETKPGYLTLFLLLLPFRRANRRLIVNA